MRNRIDFYEVRMFEKENPRLCRGVHIQDQWRPVTNSQVLSPERLAH